MIYKVILHERFLSGRPASAYPRRALHLDLIVLLKEFYSTEAVQLSRSHFRRVLKLLVSYKKLSASEQASLQTLFDRRQDKDEFVSAVARLRQLAMELERIFEGRLKSGVSEGDYPRLKPCRDHESTQVSLLVMARLSL